MAMQVYALTIDGSDSGGNFFENVFHYHLDDAAGLTGFRTAQLLITGWVSSILPAYKAMLGTDCSVRFIRCRQVTGVMPQYTAIGNVEAAGTGSSTVFSAGVSVGFRWIPDVSATVPVAGHTYIPCIPNDAVDADRIAPAFITTCLAWATLMVADLAVSSYQAQFGILRRAGMVFAKAGAGQVLHKLTMMNKRLNPQF